MKLRSRLAASIFALATLATAVAAQASTLVNFVGPTGELSTQDPTSGAAQDGPVVFTFNSAGGPGSLSYVLDGYASLDGQNYYEDDFVLNLNGTDIARATFNLGGGGLNSFVYFQPAGATWSPDVGNYTNVTWAGGQMVGTTPLDLVHGLNTLTFSYISLPGPDHAGFQGTGDEGWGLENVLVTGAAGGVPEPAAWALMILGFGGVGAVLRRRRDRVAALTA